MTPSAEPSQTALTAAAARAAHLLVDAPPYIFSDTVAAKLLGSRADELTGYHRGHPSHPILASARVQVLCRSRYTEDRLARAAAVGVRQYVILGAGLDSSGYRPGPAEQVRVFEVDHPATQAWKRRALAEARIPVPATVAFVPADLAAVASVPAGLPAGAPAGDLIGLLAGGGFDPARPALVSWLGVIMYLSGEAIGRTLAALAALAPGSEIIADYMLPAGLRDEAGNSYVDQVGPVTAQRGEPWLTFLGPDEVPGLLAGHGIEVIAQLGQRDMIPAALWARSDSLRPAALSMLVHARVTGRRPTMSPLR